MEVLYALERVSDVVQADVDSHHRHGSHRRHFRSDVNVGQVQQENHLYLNHTQGLSRVVFTVFL